MVPVGKVLGASFLYVNEQLSVMVGTPNTITQLFEFISGGGVNEGGV